MIITWFVKYFTVPVTKYLRSLPTSTELAIEPYIEPVESSPQTYISLLSDVFLLLAIYFEVYQLVFPFGFPQ
jgi:hypothetical protein